MFVMAETKKIKRVYKTLTYVPEKKLLDYLASKLYKIFTADQLTFLAFLGAIGVAVAYQFADISLNYLHFANLGIFLHWFGDSLDGRVARLRDQNRPKYGHYLDHIMDSFTITIIFGGIALSPITSAVYWITALIATLLIMNHIYLRTSVTQVFKLSLSRIGGTELRILFFFFNLLVIYGKNPIVTLDVAPLIVTILLLLTFAKAVSNSLWGKNRIPDK